MEGWGLGLYANEAYPCFYLQKNMDDVYSMDTSPRGLMLILNNKDFPNFPEGAWERRGTDVDATKLYGMFINYGFDVTRHDNLSAEVRETVVCKNLVRQVAYLSDGGILVIIDAVAAESLGGGGGGGGARGRGAPPPPGPGHGPPARGGDVDSDRETEEGGW